MSTIPPGENSYVVDQENAIEMARLIDQDRLMTKCMGGLFPPDIDVSRVHDILDIGSGPGAWVIETAYMHRKKQVTGIDISPAMLNYARTQADVQGLKNTHFLYMDATSPLTFADASFDFINARFMLGFMWREGWPKLVQECLRVLRPGGFLRLTETDNSCGVTNSLAFEQYNNLMMRAFHRTGRSFNPDPDGTHWALTPMLRQFLLQAGYQDVREQFFGLNYSAGMPEHSAFYHDLEIGLKLVQPFLIKLHLGTSKEIEELYQLTMFEMSQEDFLGILYFASAYARKPG